MTPVSHLVSAIYPGGYDSVEVSARKNQTKNQDEATLPQLYLFMLL